MPISNRHLALCLGALAALGPLSMDMYLAAMPAMAEAFGLSDGGIELTITAFFLGFGAGQLVLGPLSDRVGRKPVVVVGLCVFGLACFACAFAATFPQLLALRLLQGLGGSVCMVVAMSSIRDRITGVEADRMMGVVVSIIGIAPVVAPLIGSALLQVFPWQAIFVLLGCATVVLLLALMVFLPETLEPERRAPFRPAGIARTYGRLLTEGAFIPFAGALTFTRGTLYSYVAVASPVLISGYGLTPLQFGFVFSFNALGLVAASQIGPHLSARFGQAPFARVLVLVRAALAVLFFGLEVAGFMPLPVLLPLLFLLVASLGFAMPVLTNLSLAEQGRSAGTASALLGALGFGFGAVISFVLSSSADGTAGPLAAMTVGTSLIAALIAGFFFNRGTSTGGAD